MRVDHLQRRFLAELDGGLVAHTFGDAESATDAVVGADLDAELEGLVGGAHRGFERTLDDRGGLFDLLGVKEIRTDGRVGADEGALVALDAAYRVPDGDAVGDGALLTEGDVLVHRAVEQLVLGEGAGREFVAVEAVDDFDVLVVIGVAAIGGDDLVDGEFDPLRIDGDLAEALGAFVDGGIVLLDDVHALLLKGLEDVLLHPLLGIGIGHDGGVEVEEGGLHGGVGVTAHAGFEGELVRVDDVELRLLFGEEVLHAVRHGLDEGLIVHGGVEQEGSAFLEVGDDVELEDIGVERAGDEVGVLDVVLAVNRLFAEAEVATGRAAGLARVVLEVGLGILSGRVADDLDGVLVRGDGAVGA